MITKSFFRENRARFSGMHCGLAAATILALAGCAVGPNYKAPKTALADSFANGSQPNMSTNQAVVDWWRGFEDTKLNHLVDQSLAHNHDLRIATANLREARALRRGVQFDLLPAPNGTASYSDTQFSRAALFNAPNVKRTQELYDIGFDATWEVDFFGRVRRSVQASTAEMQAVEANRRDVEVSLISEVARNYFELRGSQNELAVAHRNADNQAETLRITLAMSEGGRGTDLDVSRSRAQLNSTLATIPPLEAIVARAIHRLGVLTGQQPTALTSELKEPAPMPTLPALVNIGNPESLLRRRPDVRSAERGLAAATASIGIATADLFPRVTFNGNIGFQASSIAGLVKPGADAWSFGPSITWAALDYGHVRSRIQAADARNEAALAFYERTVLTTLEEVENALVDFGREQARRDFLNESVKASQIAANLARQRYENGATDFLTVLDAERVLYQAQDQLAQSETRTGTALIAVYKSLGGGWENDVQSASVNVKK